MSGFAPLSGEQRTSSAPRPEPVAEASTVSNSFGAARKVVVVIRRPTVRLCSRGAISKICARLPAEILALVGDVLCSARIIRSSMRGICTVRFQRFVEELGDVLCPSLQSAIVCLRFGHSLSRSSRNPLNPRVSEMRGPERGPTALARTASKGGLYG